MFPDLDTAFVGFVKPMGVRVRVSSCLPCRISAEFYGNPQTADIDCRNSITDIFFFFTREKRLLSAWRNLWGWTISNKGYISEVTPKWGCVWGTSASSFISTRHLTKWVSLPASIAFTFPWVSQPSFPGAGRCYGLSRPITSLYKQEGSECDQLFKIRMESNSESGGVPATRTPGHQEHISLSEARGTNWEQQLPPCSKQRETRIIS